MGWGGVCGHAVDGAAAAKPALAAIQGVLTHVAVVTHAVVPVHAHRLLRSRAGGATRSRIMAGAVVWHPPVAIAACWHRRLRLCARLTADRAAAFVRRRGRAVPPGQRRRARQHHAPRTGRRRSRRCRRRRRRRAVDGAAAAAHIDGFARMRPFHVARGARGAGRGGLAGHRAGARVPAALLRGGAANKQRQRQERPARRHQQRLLLILLRKLRRYDDDRLTGRDGKALAPRDSLRLK